MGCGGGQDSKFLTDENFQVLGIDVSKKMIELAKKLSPKGNFKTISLDELENSLKFDGIWCCRVFHHILLKEQDIFLLNKDGILYIT